MYKTAVFSFFLVTSLSLEANPSERDFYRLTPEQKRILQLAYDYGRAYNLGYSMAAIAWQESFVGREIVPINLQDPSAGLWHKNIYTALEESPDIPKNGLQLNMIADRLIEDVEFAASLAIADLQHWKVVRDGNWMDVWASYNAGKYYESEHGRNYARSINKKINVLKRYLSSQ